MKEQSQDACHTLQLEGARRRQSAAGAAPVAAGRRPCWSPDMLLFVRQGVGGAAGVASAGEQHGRASFQRQSNAGIRC